MAEFFGFLKVAVIAGAALFMVSVILLSLPSSRLRQVGLECVKYATAAGLFVLVPSPVDVVPDVVPGLGWLDDLGYVVGGITLLKSARKDRKQRAFEQACENAHLARVAGLDPSVHDDEALRLLEGMGHGRA